MNRMGTRIAYNKTVRRARPAESTASVQRVADPFRQGLQTFFHGTATGRLQVWGTTAAGGKICQILYANSTIIFYRLFYPTFYAASTVKLIPTDPTLSELALCKNQILRSFLQFGVAFGLFGLKLLGKVLRRENSGQ
ncbi:hypothetical protein C8R45DRAFT_926185 [Mycena sanguinolenta]|nr:hypothetical protein C8R45DRAFT_926185 [Mycena sanguinolenta]